MVFGITFFGSKHKFIKPNWVNQTQITGKKNKALVLTNKLQKHKFSYFQFTNEQIKKSTKNVFFGIVFEYLKSHFLDDLWIVCFYTVYPPIWYHIFSNFDWPTLDTDLNFALRLDHHAVNRLGNKRQLN